jgi:hypothetical protein
MRLKPVARGALSPTNFFVAHQFGDLTPQSRRVQVAARRRDVEPLMRQNHIDGYAVAGRMHHAEVETSGCVTGFCDVNRRQFDACHLASLLVWRSRLVSSLSAHPCRRRGLLAPASAIIGIKFEWQFKYRDESKMKSSKRRRTRDTKSSDE